MCELNLDWIKYVQIILMTVSQDEIRPYLDPPPLIERIFLSDILCNSWATPSPIGFSYEKAMRLPRFKIYAQPESSEPVLYSEGAVPFVHLSDLHLADHRHQELRQLCLVCHPAYQGS